MKLPVLKITAAVSVLAMLLAALHLTGCATPASAPVAGNVKGAQIWAQNCAHCHNIRSPSAYSDAQWDVVMLHMRVRGNLTADDHHAILAFLKSAH